jgi:hypothetical protein
MENRIASRTKRMYLGRNLLNGLPKDRILKYVFNLAMGI